MMQTLIDVFMTKYERENEHTIVDNYIVSPGTYHLVDIESGKQLDTLIIEPKLEYDVLSPLYRKIAQYDYLSRIITMNKPIDPKKIIHSNNYFSFSMKADAKLQQSNIDNYYKILKNPSKEKYEKKKEQRLLYESAEKEFGTIDGSTIEACENWINENIYALIDAVDEKVKKNYLKIFFVFQNKPLEEMAKLYEIESQRYILPNIFSDASYNVEVDGVTYGMPGENLNLNSKKPFLATVSRKEKVPYKLSHTNAYQQKLLFDYLEILCNQGKYQVIVDFDKQNIEGYKWLDLPDTSFHGLFLKIRKVKKGVEIYSMDTVVQNDDKMEALEIENCLNIELANVKVDLSKTPVLNKIGARITSKKELAEMIDWTFYNGKIRSNNNSDEKDIKLYGKIKPNLLSFRDSYVKWFYLGNVEALHKAAQTLLLNRIFDEFSLLESRNFYRIQEMLILRENILSYFEGGKRDMKETDNIRKKFQLLVQEGGEIENDDALFYYTSGQLLSYLLTYSRSAKVSMQPASRMINMKNKEAMEKEIAKLVSKYAYAIDHTKLVNESQYAQNQNFKNVYQAFLAYNPQEQTDELKKQILIGYMDNNFRYFKRNEKSE